MRFIATADTDIGQKQINQDSVLLKHASSSRGEILMLVICDGLGGLKMGEVASSTVVHAFSDWFDYELSFELENLNMEALALKWEALLQELNQKILRFGLDNQLTLGTTFSGILFIEDRYFIVHVGDTRIYYINEMIEQLTTDQTYVAREMARGNMTPEQARVDKRRNTLLQCVGANQRLQPQILHGQTRPGTYLVCSDGFRHEVSGQEMVEYFHPRMLGDKETMHNHAKTLIHLAKQRNERDNISVAVARID